MQIELILPLFLYLILLFCISIYAFVTRQKSQLFADYFIGNRSMGGFLLAMSLTATYISASSFIGGPGAAYRYGLFWVLISLIQVPTIFLSLGILGKKFAILARRYNAITLNDMLMARYQSRKLVVLASTCLLIAFIATMSVQFIGAAHLLSTTLNISYFYCLIAFSLITISYTALGGFRAGIFNDALQGVIMIIGSFLLLGFVIYHSGGIPNAIKILDQIDPELLSPFGTEEIATFPFILSFWVLAGFGVLGLPHTAIKCIAYKDSRSVHQGILIGTLVMTLLMFTLHLTGVLGRAIIPDLDIPDTIMPKLMIAVLPPIVAGIFLIAPLAAIMSTINAQLLQASATIVKDLYLGMHPNKQIKNQRLSQISILVTLAIGILLIFTSLYPPDMLIWLNLTAFGGLQATFLWPLVLGLYWDKANAYGAITSIIVGVSCYMLLTITQSNLFGFFPIIPSLLLSGLAFLFANFLRNRKIVLHSSPFS